MSELSAVGYKKMSELSAVGYKKMSELLAVGYKKMSELRHKKRAHLECVPVSVLISV